MGPFAARLRISCCRQSLVKSQQPCFEYLTLTSRLLQFPESLKGLLASLPFPQIFLVLFVLREWLRGRIGIARHGVVRQRVGVCAEDGVHIGVFIPADAVEEEVPLPAFGKRLRGSMETDRHL